MSTCRFYAYASWSKCVCMHVWMKIGTYGWEEETAVNVGGRLERVWRMYSCQRQSRTFIGTDWCACSGHCRGQYRCRYILLFYKNLCLLMVNACLGWVTMTPCTCTCILNHAWNSCNIHGVHTSSYIACTITCLFYAWYTSTHDHISITFQRKITATLHNLQNTNNIV